MSRPLLRIVARCYHVAYKLHHRLCLRPGKPLAHAQLVVVGSYLAGGAGKTPFVAWLTQFILAQHSPAQSVPELSGHENPAGRGGAEASQTRGPRIAILCHSKAKDEAQMLRQKFAGTPQVCIYTTGNRYKTAHELDSEFDYIICDDGFEDSRLAGATTIRLDWGEPPAGLSDLLPAVRCRSLPADHEKPALALACGTDIRFEIERIANCEGAPVEPSASSPAKANYRAVAICGIGDAERFTRDLEAFGCHPGSTIRRPDHDRNFEQTIKKVLARKVPVIITEKDAARLPRDMRENPGIYVAVQLVTVSGAATESVARALS